MRIALAAVVAVLLALSPGCTRRQVIPGVVAGVGSGLMVGGFAYSATRDEGSGFFGSTTGEAAAIGSMVFGGIALAVVGILWSITAADCDSDADCWSGDVCLLASNTCVAADSLAAPPPTGPPEPPEDAPDAAEDPGVLADPEPADPASAVEPPSPAAEPPSPAVEPSSPPPAL